WFPDEGHWVLKPRNSQLWYKTVLDWIDAHSRNDPAVHPDRSRETPHQASSH
ncbi:MAG TPA: prolyl oligopeptidase family serine peptidase, partial [Myxococcaceae bacterium]|nr:prolyl oligopeptidase family serine peptidase [Myxococcaceae bacterium]